MININKAIFDKFQNFLPDSLNLMWMANWYKVKASTTVYASTPK